MPNIRMLCITGGPCAGKTTILAHLKSDLEDRGRRVLIIPETATELIREGILPGKGEALREFQKLVLKRSIAKEDEFLRMASELPCEEVVIITDRGLMDGAAYVGKAAFREIVEELGHTITDLRDKRYHGVIHLVTAADGAEKFYTLANNSARSETAEKARELDRQTAEAWNGCPHLSIVTNTGADFEEKKLNALAVVCHVLGIPHPIERERKFLVEEVDYKTMEKLGVSVEPIQITQTYLKRDAGTLGEERVRERRQHGSAVHFHTVKHALLPGERIETERIITEAEYKELLRRADRNRRQIYKIRSTFIWRGQYFELDQFIDPSKSYMILEVELASRNALIDIPPFVKEYRDVTDDPAYSNRELARIA